MTHGTAGSKKGLLSPEELCLSKRAPGAPESLGEQAVLAGLLQRAELEECLRDQELRARNGNEVPLQQILIERRLVTPRDIEKLSGWASGASSPVQNPKEELLGRMAVELGWITPEQLSEARTLQAIAAGPLLETLVSRGWITAGQRAELESARRRHPAQLGHYRILEEIGAGGAARVYLGEDLTLHRPVAVKILQSLDPLQVTRFRREALVSASLDHPNIVKIFGSGEQDGLVYFVMQHISGGPIHRAGLSLPDAVRSVQKIAYALHHAHEKGILHRDVKPANILMDEAGEPYLADFGLGRETHGVTISRTGTVMGTPVYMSPEQARGNLKKVDARSDLYSLGATLYELVVGRPPFSGEHSFEILEKSCKGQLEAPRKACPSVSRDLEAVILKAMSLEPEQRYGNARAFGDDLGRFLEGKPVEAQRPSGVYLLKKAIRRNPATSSALAVAAASVMFTVSFFLFSGGSASSGVEAKKGEDLWFYRDALERIWTDMTYDAVADYASRESVAVGERSVRVEIQKDWGALSCCWFGTEIQNPSAYSGLEFRVRSADGPKNLYMLLECGKTKFPSVRTTITGSEWTTVFLPMSQLNPQNHPFNRLNIQSNHAGVLFFDEIRLVGASPR